MLTFRLFTALTIAALAPLAYAKAVQVPRDQDVLSEVRRTNMKDPALRLSPRVSLMVWNLLKGETAGWEREYAQAAADRNLILIQEGMLNPNMKTGLTDAKVDFLYTFAASFLFDKFLTGVYTGAPALPIGRQFFRSPEREPLGNTPKMALRMDYVLENGQVLRVVNVHALNFASDETHARQIAVLIKDMSSHTGPMILAGDFNIFNETRWANVENLTRSIGLQQVRVNDKPDVQNLDHIFVKGCEPAHAWDRDSQFSDHPILFADLTCGN